MCVFGGGGSRELLIHAREKARTVSPDPEPTPKGKLFCWFLLHLKSHLNFTLRGDIGSQAHCPCFFFFGDHPHAER